MKFKKNETIFRPDMVAIDKSALKTIEESKEKGNEKSREKIIRILPDNPIITTKEMAQETGLSIASVEKIIRMLKVRVKI